jgi:CelD/BcsL family acetyltransferase involved in cellulose biosynthesis
VIEIGQLAPAEEDAWDHFLLSNPGGLVYHSIRYRDLLVEHLGCEAEYLVARGSGEIRGVLPLMWTRDADGRLCNSLPFYGSHGGVIADDPKVERALLDAWNERATDPGTLGATMVANPFLDRELPAPIHAMTDERISQVTPLPGRADEEEIMGQIHSSARRNVRKAKRLGVSVERDNGAIAELNEIHQESMRAIGGLAKSEEFFALLPRHLRAGEDFDLWVARLEGETVAALLVLRFNGVAEYFVPATRVEHRSANPNSVLLLAAMTDAAGSGCRLWNWGGTWIDQTGVYRFKRKWAASERRYRYFVQLNDQGLLDSTPEQLRLRFPHFYVAPFSALRSAASAGERR